MVFGPVSPRSASGGEDTMRCIAIFTASLGACPNICSCSRMAAGFRWALAFSASAQPCGALSPSIYPDAAGAAPDLQKIVGQADQLPLGRHFLQASQQKLADSSRGLDHAEYRLDDVLAPRRELYQSPYAVCAASFPSHSLRPRVLPLRRRAAAASGGTGASWCFCRPVAMCGSMPIFSNSSTASLLK